MSNGFSILCRVTFRALVGTNGVMIRLLLDWKWYTAVNIESFGIRLGVSIFG